MSERRLNRLGAASEVQEDWLGKRFRQRFCLGGCRPGGRQLRRKLLCGAEAEVQDAKGRHKHRRNSHTGPGVRDLYLNSRTLAFSAVGKSLGAFCVTLPAAAHSVPR